MESIKVRILHNLEEPECFYRGYRYGDRLVEVYEADKRLPYRLDATISLDYITDENRWNDGRVPWYEDARSTVIGDVLVLHDKAWAIEQVGYRQLDPVEAQIEELVI